MPGDQSPTTSDGCAPDATDSRAGCAGGCVAAIRTHAACAVASAAATVNDRIVISRQVRPTSKIDQLTDVSHCKLQKYLQCEMHLLHRLRDP
jgi:hypothetical protein